MRHEFIYPFRNSKGGIVQVWEWVSYFIPHFTGHVIIFLSMLGFKLIHVSKRGPWRHKQPENHLWYDIGPDCAVWSELPPVRVNLCRTWTHTQIYTSILFHVYFNSIIKLALCNGYHAMIICHIIMKNSHKIDISHNSRSWDSNVVMYAHDDDDAVTRKYFYIFRIHWWSADFSHRGTIMRIEINDV